MKTKILAVFAAILALTSLSSCDPYNGSGRSSYQRSHHSHPYGGYPRSSGSVGGYRGGGAGGGFGGSFGGFGR